MIRKIKIVTSYPRTIDVSIGATKGVKVLIPEGVFGASLNLNSIQSSVDYVYYSTLNLDVLPLNTVEDMDIITIGDIDPYPLDAISK